MYVTLVTCIIYSILLGRFLAELQYYMTGVLSSYPQTETNENFRLIGLAGWLVITSALVYTAKSNWERAGFAGIVVSTVLLVLRDLIELTRFGFFSLQIVLCFVAVSCLAISISYQFSNRE